MNPPRDFSKRALQDMIPQLYGPPVELPVIPVPEDPCEGYQPAPVRTMANNPLGPDAGRLDLSTGEVYY